MANVTLDGVTKIFGSGDSPSERSTRSRVTIDLDPSTRYRSIHPVGRLGRPENVAGAVSFLAGDGAVSSPGPASPSFVGTAVMQDDALPGYDP